VRTLRRLGLAAAITVSAAAGAGGAAAQDGGPVLDRPAARALTLGATVRVELDGRRYTGYLRSLEPDLVIEAARGDTVRVPRGTPLFLQERPCDTNDAAEAGAWAGMFTGLAALLVVDGTWPSIGAYVGSIFAGTVIGTGVRVVDCRRWKRVR
jgi:hypothetical protein